MGVDWELRESGPADADPTVLLLPDGLNTAGSYAALMAQPALAVRLVAATLPGHGGTPPPDDLSIENYAGSRPNSPPTPAATSWWGSAWEPASRSPAVRLCDAGVPTWVVHAEKGDGGLTDDERRTLEACPHTSVITIPGTSYFIPNEEPERVAELVVEALDRVG